MRHNRVKGGDAVLGPCSFYPPYYLIQASQLYWSGVPFPSPGDLPDPGVKPCVAGRFFTDRVREALSSSETVTKNSEH